MVNKLMANDEYKTLIINVLYSPFTIKFKRQIVLNDGQYAYKPNNRTLVL